MGDDVILCNIIYVGYRASDNSKKDVRPISNIPGIVSIVSSQETLFLKPICQIWESNQFLMLSATTSLSYPLNEYRLLHGDSLEYCKNASVVIAKATFREQHS